MITGTVMGQINERLDVTCPHCGQFSGMIQPRIDSGYPTYRCISCGGIISLGPSPEDPSGTPFASPVGPTSRRPGIKRIVLGALLTGLGILLSLALLLELSGQIQPVKPHPEGAPLSAAVLLVLGIALLWWGRRVRASARRAAK